MHSRPIAGDFYLAEFVDIEKLGKDLLHNSAFSRNSARSVRVVTRVQGLRCGQLSL